MKRNESYRILSIIWMIFIFTSCCNKFIDTTHSFKEWNKIPMNSKFLEIRMYNADNKNIIKNHSYYLSQYRGSVRTIYTTLVEVNDEKNILNIFPIPTNGSHYDIIKGTLFHSPELNNNGLRIYAEYKNDTAFISFKLYPVIAGGSISTDSIPYFNKSVILDFKNKTGILIDTTTSLNHKIWF